MNSIQDSSKIDQQAVEDSQEEFLRYLLRRRGGKVTADVVAAAREEYGFPRSTLYRLVARFMKTQRTSSLRPQKRGTKDGEFRLDSRTEQVIADQIRDLLAQKRKTKHRCTTAAHWGSLSH